MAFYLKKAIFVNRAPFERIELDFKVNGINVLSSVNGKGKTTILSHIVDAFYELARPAYANEFEGKSNKYYRVSSNIFNLDQNQPSFVYLRFSNNNQEVDYVDVQGKCSLEQYVEAIRIENKIPYNKFSNEFKSSNNLKYWHITSKKNNTARAIFENNILTYFPAYRSERPFYLNECYDTQISYRADMSFSGYLPNPIEVCSNIHEMVNWIMDVVVDWEINKKEGTLKDEKRNVLTKIDLTPEYQIVWNNLIRLIQSLLTSKKLPKNTRLGIGRRMNSTKRVSVLYTKDGKDNIVSPNLFCLSSGEMALLCCFGELLRQSDKIKPDMQISNISGIVLIDEVDKHLHIKLQKEVLPKLFQMFPKIQFIVTSHSPFLNMGLADMQSKETQIFDLDNNGLVCSPKNNELYSEVYQMFVNENNRYAEMYKKLQTAIEKAQKTIVLTEGITDVKYLQKAKEKLCIKDIDFDFIGSEAAPSGDINLRDLLKQLARVPRANKIIGIFDRDNDKIIQELCLDNQRYKNFGNNVYGFCIPIPEERKRNGQTKISIEYLFKDDEIKRFLPNGCRLFLGTEFTKNSLRHNSDDLVLKIPQGKGKDKIIENNGDQAVLDTQEKNVLAKKVDFAEAIMNNDIAISDESWHNFQAIFDIISEIQNL